MDSRAVLLVEGFVFDIHRARYPNLRPAYVDQILSYRFVHYFYVPPDSVCDLVTEYSSGGGGGGTPAKDALGNDIVAEEWLKTHGPGDRTLTQGLKVTNGIVSIFRC